MLFEAFSSLGVSIESYCASFKSFKPSLRSKHSIHMADPLSVTSTVVGLIAVSCQASKALRETIHSYKNHTKNVRDLKDELEALEETLQLLDATLPGLDVANFTALESPLRRCGCALG
jgi:hypothetical protein